MPIKNKIPLNKEKKPWDKESLEKFEIDPNLYTHLCIVEALQAIPKSIESGKIENGFMALDNAVDQLENILIARNLMDEENQDYKSKVEFERNRLIKLNLYNTMMLNAKIANFKFRFLLKKAFGVKAKTIDAVM